jgi:hypothetical protein
MVLTDKIMAGRYDNFVSAIINIAKNEGFFGFYRGWLPALVQKIPSYALTWMFFQQVKLVRPISSTDYYKYHVVCFLKVHLLLLLL